MTRKQAIELIKLATAEGDTKTATTIYLENRISRKAFNDACEKGESLKQILDGRKLSETTFSDL